MNLAIELLVIGIAIPAAVAAVVTWIGLRFATHGARLYAIPAAMALAYVISYTLLPEWASIKPERHWQWLPYLAMAAAVVGPVGFAAGRPAWVRSLALTALAVGAAFLLVPNWPDLQPARQLSIALVALYLSSLILSVEWLAPRLSPAVLLGLLATGGAALAITLAGIVSVRFGLLAVMSAAALAGCCLASIIVRQPRPLELRSAAPLYAVLFGGAAYVGCIEPQPPLWWLLLMPAVAVAMGAIVWQFRPYRASASSGQ